MSVYLDYQAAKPVDIRVISDMTVYLNQKFANPSSLHCDGDEATDALSIFRQKIADFIWKSTKYGCQSNFPLDCTKNRFIKNTDN